MNRAADLTPEQRVNPANTTRWYCSGGYAHTVVLATCIEEAKAIAAMWLTRSRPGRRPIRYDEVTARPATDEQVDRWIDARYQPIEDAGRVEVQP